MIIKSYNMKFRELTGNLKEHLRKHFIFILCFIVIYGFSFWHIEQFSVLTAQPFRLLPESIQFVHYSPSDILIGYCLRFFMPVTLAYLLIHAAAILGIYILFWKFCQLRNVDFQYAAKLLALSPLLLILFTWFGKPDPLLILGFLIVLTAERFLYIFLGFTLCIFSHPQISLFYLVCLFVLDLNTTTDSKAKILNGWFALSDWNTKKAYIISFILGNLLFQYYLMSFEVMPFGRSHWLMSNWRWLLSSLIQVPVAHLWLTLGWLWLVIFMHTTQRDYKLAILLAISFLISLGTLDYTRIFLLTSFPVILYISMSKLYQDRYKAIEAILPIGLLSLVQFQVHGGVVVDSAWSFFWEFKPIKDLLVALIVN